MVRKIAFPYFGGKQKYLKLIVPNIPADAKHFIDVFGGSATVLLNAGDFPTKTYNDLNGDVVNFFKQMRDNPEELIRQLELTPYSREELEQAKEIAEDGIERARRFIVRARQGYGNLSVQTTKSGRYAAQWSRSVKIPLHRSHTFVRGIDKLKDLVEDIRLWQIENRDALKVIRQYDDKDAFFYCDPPYVSDTRTGGDAYKFEMTDEDHKCLGDALNGIEGRAMVSGYRSSLYDEMFKSWKRLDGKEKPVHGGMRKATESIWMNYE